MFGTRETQNHLTFVALNPSPRVPAEGPANLIHPVQWILRDPFLEDLNRRVLLSDVAVGDIASAEVGGGMVLCARRLDWAKHGTDAIEELRTKDVAAYVDLSQPQLVEIIGNGKLADSDKAAADHLIDFDPPIYNI